jgi:hypothetical protein
MDQARSQQAASPLLRLPQEHVARLIQLLRRPLPMLRRDVDVAEEPLQQARPEDPARADRHGLPSRACAPVTGPARLCTYAQSP